MKRIFLFLFVISSQLVQAQVSQEHESFSVDFLPSEFINWCLSPNDFKAQIENSKEWILESSEELPDGLGKWTYYTYRKNTFVTVGKFEYLKGNDGYYAINLPDGSWILQLMSEVIKQRDSGSLELDYNLYKRKFNVTTGTYSMDISFSKAMFVVLLIVPENK